MKGVFLGQLVNTAEDLGWTVRQDKDGFEFETYSPAGEDFVFYIHGKTKQIVNRVARYADEFDADEHAQLWIDSRGKGGVPDSIRALIDDADAIQVMLDDLASALADTQKKYYQSFQRQEK